MTFSTSLRHRGHLSLGIAALAAVGLIVALPGNAQAAVSPVPLGTAESFVVLGGSAVSNTGPTTLRGDLGLYPGSDISGTSTLTVTGTNHGGDAVTQGAKTDLVTAYNATAGKGPTAPITGDLGGKTLKPGVYNNASAIGLTGALTLDAAGDPNAVFVFQAGSALTTASGSRVNLRNGARSCNVFWQIGSSATLGTGSTFVGTVMAMSSITVTTGTTVVGRVLARNAAVTLDTANIIRPTSCAASASTQVTKVPSGGVSTGDGSTSGSGSGSLGLLTGVLAFAGFGSAAFVATRRRRAKA